MEKPCAEDGLREEPERLRGHGWVEDVVPEERAPEHAGPRDQEKRLGECEPEGETKIFSPLNSHGITAGSTTAAKKA